MRIAVDTRFLQSASPDLRSFTKEVFTRLAIQHPDHVFIFFTDVSVNAPDSLPQNVSTITVTPKPTNFLLHKWWYDVKLSYALKKHKADVFIATYGLGSLTASVPQIVIIRELAFLQTAAYFPAGSYSFYKKYTSRYAKKAKAVLTLSDFIKDELAAHFTVAKENIVNIGSGASASFKPVDWTERELFKEKFAEGFEYFVFNGGLHSAANLLHVLKAFSIFKKWQRTNMKLVITGTFDAAFEKDLGKLNSYKYRNEVFIKKDLSGQEVSELVAASYALIYPSFPAGFASSVLEAMYCEVPVITSPNSSMTEIAADAALYADPRKPEELAEQMKKIFKDEQTRNKLIEAARLRAKFFSWDKTAGLLWGAIEQVVSK